MSCGQISSGHSMSWSSAVSRSIGITPGSATIIGSATATEPGTFDPPVRAGGLLFFHSDPRNVGSVTRWPAGAGRTAGRGSGGVMPEISELDFKARVGEILNRRPAVGFALGVVRNGSLEFFYGRGVADVGSKKPVAEDTVFRIATITKTFTARALAHERHGPGRGDQIQVSVQSGSHRVPPPADR
jgi:CubicO group peptidase (beta-lactamase class C family)